MKIYCKALAITAILSALSMPVFAQNASGSGSQRMLASAELSGPSEAMQMTSARATLSRTLDADKDHQDSTIEARLPSKVTLSDGTVLPSNTKLIGTVTQDDMQQVGTSQLALRFSEAQLKNGKVVPIKVTIVDIIAPDTDPDALDGWTDQTLSVERINVVSGVDLHSNIASDNSGVFVSTKKHDVKVPGGSEFRVAIGPASSGSTPAS